MAAYSSSGARALSRMEAESNPGSCQQTESCRPKVLDADLVEGAPSGQRLTEQFAGVG